MLELLVSAKAALVFSVAVSLVYMLWFRRRQQLLDLRNVLLSVMIHSVSLYLGIAISLALMFTNSPTIVFANFETTEIIIVFFALAVEGFNAISRHFLGFRSDDMSEREVD